MKVLIFSVLLLFSTQAAKGADQHYTCLCNFNACLGEKDKECTKIIRCKKITAGDYSSAVGNHKALFVWSNTIYCAKP